LLGPLNLDLHNIDWVIVGGESGTGYRPMHPDWARGVREQCLAADVPFFFKQVGGVRPKSGGRLLDGVEWNELPTVEQSQRTAAEVVA
jgi:protein gp37